MKFKLLILASATASCYAAQAPLPKIPVKPLASSTGVTVLSPELLSEFKSLIDAMNTSTDPKVNEIKKKLTDLYQQAVNKKIYITALGTQLKIVLNKMKTDPEYKDKKFESPLFGAITLAQFADTFTTLSSHIGKIISLLAITPQKISYLKEIIDALPSGKNIPEKINNTRLELIRLLDDVQNKKISLDEVIAKLYGIKEMFETQPSIKNIEFESPKYGKVKLSSFSEIVLGDLIDQISKRETKKIVPSSIIFAELEEPSFSQASPPATPVAAPTAKPIPTPAPTKPAITPPLPTPPIVAKPAAAPLSMRPHGLSNIGNNCFMNASLQSLYTLTELNNQLIAHADRYKPDTFGAEYINLLNLMRDPTSGVIEPRAICHRGWAKMGFNPLTQQDNDEFINALLDELLGNPLDPENLPKPQRKLLEIQTQTFLAGKPEDIESSVLLTIPANCPSLEECLKKFFAVEKVERGYPKKPGDPLPIVDKQEKIVSTGQYLIIHLKRNIQKLDPKTKKVMFRGKEMLMDKLTDPIPFPIINLDLNAYTIPGVKLPLYRLNAIVIHAGSARGGHYTGYVRYDNQWYFVNDSQVSPVSTQEIERIAKQGYGSDKGQTPTTLFYERQ